MKLKENRYTKLSLLIQVFLVSVPNLIDIQTMKEARQRSFTVNRIDKLVQSRQFSNLMVRVS